jgi:hypothetical protein
MPKEQIAKKPKNRTGVYTRPDAEKKHYTEDYKTDIPYGNLAKGKADKKAFYKHWGKTNA